MTERFGPAAGENESWKRNPLFQQDTRNGVWSTCKGLWRKRLLPMAPALNRERGHDSYQGGKDYGDRTPDGPGQQTDIAGEKEGHG
jgi:hypothetical protein